MVATTGYQAAPETNNVIFSYGAETAWGVKPAVQFQAIRLTGESMAGTKTRNRPGEINATGEVTAATTVQESAGGDIKFALSYGTFDDLIAGALNADWGTPQVIAGVAADIVFTAPGSLTSTTTNKFQNIVVGQWIRLMGFTSPGNNGFARVAGKATNQSITLAGVTNAGNSAARVTETPTGTLAQIRASSIINSNMFKSFYAQKQFSSALFLQYPGCFVSAMTLTGGVGQFLSGSFSLLAQQEMSAIVTGSTGAVLAAPTGLVHDPIAGFKGAFLNETAINAVVDSFTISTTATGAAQEYGMGSSAAQGMMMGLLEAKGSMKLFFKDFTYYAMFKAETSGALEFITTDPAGNAYVITLPKAFLMNPKIEAGGPNQAVYAIFDIEGSPQSAGGTIQIDRLPAV